VIGSIQPTGRTVGSTQIYYIVCNKFRAKKLGSMTQMKSKEEKTKDDPLQVNRIDILEEKIETSFKSERDKIPEYEDRLNAIIKQLSTAQLKSDSRERLSSEKTRLEDRIYDLANDVSYGFLKLELEPIIEDYRDSIKNSVKVSFVKLSGSTSTKKGDSGSNSDRYKKIYNDYLKALRKYKSFLNFEIPKATSNTTKMYCENCNNSKDFELILDRLYVCSECGEQVKEIISAKSSYKDVERVAISSKYKYIEENHFKDRIKQLQARQKVTIKPKLYSDFDGWLIAHNLIENIGEPIDQAARIIKYSKVKYKHTLMFLKESDWNDNYEDAMLIWTTHTGKKAPDFSNIENDIIEDYQQIKRIYMTLNIKDRESFPNAYIILYQLLLKRSFKTDPVYFNLTKGDDVLDWHNDILEKIFDQLEWNYHPIG